MSGNFPLSPNGNISIKGRVNAIEGARLVGQNVYIGGRRDAAHLDHASKFASTVNSTGLRSGAGIVVRNGSIQIVAAETAHVNSRLSTAGRGDRNGGDITVTAKNINVGKNANIWSNARGNTGAGNAGNITFLANDTLRVTSGAFFNASSRRGNAGTRLDGQAAVDHPARRSRKAEGLRHHGERKFAATADRRKSGRCAGTEV